jgi:hypothetical protein
MKTAKRSAQAWRGYESAQKGICSFTKQATAFTFFAFARPRKIFKSGLNFANSSKDFLIFVENLT